MVKSKTMRALLAAALLGAADGMNFARVDAFERNKANAIVLQRCPRRALSLNY